MNHFLAVLAFAGTVLFPSLISTPGWGGDDFDARLSRVRAVVLKSDSSRAEVTTALTGALHASLLILPAKDYPVEFRSRVEAARTMLENGALLEDKTRQLLLLAYKTVSGGTDWEIPKALRTSPDDAGKMDRAKLACVALLDSAAAEHRAGRNESAVRDLVSFVILVITPIERGEGAMPGLGVELPATWV